MNRNESENTAGGASLSSDTAADQGSKNDKEFRCAQATVGLQRPEPLIVSLETAAQMLDMCKRTLERERDRGEIRCLRIGRHWKVRVAELHAYLRRKEKESVRG